MGGTRERITVDLGNSTCKARRWKVSRPPGRPERLQSWEHPTRRGVGAELALWLSSIPPDVRAGCASVATAELGREVELALAGRLVAPLGAGLAVDYRTPETLGVDRLYAARAAAEHVGCSCLVVDAGTAVTVDALRIEPDGARTFLGGAIAPGPALLARALHVGTARLPEIVPELDAPALGKDTHAALAAGVVHGFRGLVRGLVDAVAREAGLEDAPVVLGGGASALLGEFALPGRTVARLDDLVHLGLLAALSERLDGVAR